jgi:rhodanese-related sulfurtransferase
MPVKNVTVREAHQRQGQGYTYVDVRSIPEFENGHPAGAVNIPLLHRNAQSGHMMPNPEFIDVMRANFPCDAKLLIGCQVGGRSANAAQLLAQAGFTDVSNVVGGWGGASAGMPGLAPAEGWAQAGLPAEAGRSEGRDYGDLHAKLAERGPVAE